MPVWRTSYSVWEAKDPHARAGIQLLSDRSRQMVAVLIGSKTPAEAEFLGVLRARCVSCHVTVDAKAVSHPELLPRVDLAEGVSCESCHGPASQWLQEHTSESWQGPARFDPSTGMGDTESWLTRTVICAKCHVGSRSEDGIVRDMNHDLIAAGHPAFRFDMTVYFRNLPRHWEGDPASGKLEVSHLQRHNAARFQVLSAAAELTRDRLVAARTDPLVVWPELADFDCFACHHGLAVDRKVLSAEPDGLPAWNPWYTALLNLPRDEWDPLKVLAQAPDGFSEDPRFASLLDSIAADARREAQGMMAGEPGDPVAQLIDTVRNGDSLRTWYEAAAWYLQVKAALRDAARAGTALPAAEAELARLATDQLQFDRRGGRWDSPAQFEIRAVQLYRDRLLQQCLALPAGEGPVD